MNVQLDASQLPAQGSETPKEMLSWEVTPDGRTHYRVNFSSLSIMQECQRKVQYSLLRKLSSNLSNSATTFGSAIHKGLEVYYSARRTERRIPAGYADVMNMIGCGHWEDSWSDSLLFTAARAFVLKAMPLNALPDDNKRSIATGVWMLRHYFEKYLTDEYVIMSDASGPIVERRVSLRIHEDARYVVDLFGTIDAVVRSEVTGQILAVDHKTSSRLYNFYDAINPNHQYTGYLWATREVLGFDTDSFLVNILEVKPPPKTAKGSCPDFARQVTTRNQDDFDELRDAILLNLMIFRANLEASKWPMSAPGACTKYSGCQYLDICAAPKQLRENIITAKFTEAGR